MRRHLSFPRGLVKLRTGVLMIKRGFFNGLNISFTAPDTYTKDSMRLFIYLY
ncbi:hypothetical protein [Chryseobacterium sp. CFS15]|uniref:hypothetical protein n=1 Tax=Chryseobacterium sp. CFS15 TaxID=2986946 RepID=UPI002808D3AD|nr:hypothetical protein [Chryseobacterium sp. CFS15]MDQ8141792.1 hypothetical protein [Chryseobacterium sp. CFS15]